MSEFEQQPDDFWRKTFDEAAETPPPRVWDAIERRLDESEGPRVLPLWGTGLGASRPVLWGAGLAAAVALLLVGWWALPTQPTPNPVALVARKGDSRPTTARPNAASVDMPAASAGRVNRSVDVTPAPDADSRTLALNSRRSIIRHRANTVTGKFVENSIESLVQADRQLPRSTAINPTEPASAPVPALVAGQSSSQPVAATPFASRSVPTITLAQVPQVAVTDQTAQSSNVSVAQSTAQPAVLRESDLSSPAGSALSVEPEAVQPKRKSREVWASVSMMPGAFNPAVGLRTATNPTLANAAAVNYAVSNTPTVNSRANFSVAYQASAGVQLTEHWSVESGVGYLSAHSTVESPTQTTSYTNQFAGPNALLATDPSRASTGSVSNLYVNILRGQTSTARASGLTNADALLISNNYQVIGNYSNQARLALTNDYQYVQVPVQVGYQLRPRKRLGLALLGGFLTNIFVRNTVADDLVITSRDGVYRPLSWAASLGARFRYRPSRRWSASLAGLYQPSLGLGTRPESVVQSQPTSVGMSFGVDYHF